MSRRQVQTLVSVSGAEGPYFEDDREVVQCDFGGCCGQAPPDRAIGWYTMQVTHTAAEGESYTAGLDFYGVPHLRAFFADVQAHGPRWLQGKAQQQWAYE